MIKEYFFPTIIYIKDLPNANELNPYLEKHIVEWSNQDKGVSKTNVNGWHSQTDMNQRKEYEPLIKELFQMQEEGARNSAILFGCPSRPSKKFSNIIRLPKPSEQ